MLKLTKISADSTKAITKRTEKLDFPYFNCFRKVKVPKTQVILTHNRNRDTAEYKEYVWTRENVERKRESKERRK